MADSSQQQSAIVSEAPSLSRVWIVPIVALFIGLWMVYQQWQNQGTTITIAFESAAGIEAGKTKIKTRDVDVGVVRSIRLAEDNNAVLVDAQVNQNAEHLLNEDSNFWVVTPRVGITGVTGLTTLLSGNYIELAPGMSGQMSTSFTGLSDPPITPAGTPGLHITLNSNDRFAYEKGDPIIYKGLTVGQIEDIYFNLYERVVYYNAFVRAPYHQLLTNTTRFWDTSGVRLDLSSDGIQLQTGNIETLVTNGIEFGIPEGAGTGETISERSYYDIFANYDEAVSARYKFEAKFVILIDESVRGLNVGAPVEYRGFEIGRVLEVNPQTRSQDSTTLLDEGYKIPVVISVQPGRVGQPDNEVGVKFVKDQTLLWIKNGFRASLKTGNLLTGAQFVELQFYNLDNGIETDDSPSTFMGLDVVPTVSDEFTQITQKLTAILDTVNNMKLDEVAQNTNTMLDEVALTAQDFRNTSAEYHALATDPELKQLSQQLNQTLNQVNALLADYAAGSSNYEELNRTLRSVNQVMGDIRPLLLELNRSPNSLIFTGPSSQEFEPKARGTIDEK